MKRGFTLIELLAVIVILSIIALIAVPIVVNIINDSKKSSDEESIKMYAKAVENAVGNYFLKHPNEKSVTIEQLEGLINYSGERIECETTEILPNGVLYLGKCKINGEESNYTYNPSGITLYKSYSVGNCEDEATYVNYKGEKWCVIKNSSKFDDYVTLMRYMPLKSGETTTMSGYGAVHSTGSWKYSISDSYIVNHWFYTSEECGFQVAWNTNSIVETGCINEYDRSHIKEKVDAYGERLGLDNLKEIDGYKIRLIKKSELESLGISNGKVTEETKSWVNISPCYWTMTKEEGNNRNVYIFDRDYGVIPISVYGESYQMRYGFTRPVINLYKSAIEE